MMDNRLECRCERGGDCTKTTLCQVQHMVQQIEELQAERDNLQLSLMVNGRHDMRRIKKLRAWKAAAETVLTPGELKTIERLARGE